MKIDAKQLYDKMVDYHRFASVLLAVGVFLYLGMIIPEDLSTQKQLVTAGGSVAFIAGSLLFFFQSKKLRKRLEETDEGQEYLMKK
jgi:uncharacterized membrane protein YgdD (TMEM256/DUF423 family)